MDLDDRRAAAIQSLLDSALINVPSAAAARGSAEPVLPVRSEAFKTGQNLREAAGAGARATMQRVSPLGTLLGTALHTYGRPAAEGLQGFLTPTQ